MGQEIAGKSSAGQKPQAGDEPFEEVYNRHAKVGVIQEKTFTLEEIDRRGKRVHRHHDNPEQSWLQCTHPECELWQSKFDSTPSPGDVVQ